MIYLQKIGKLLNKQALKFAEYENKTIFITGAASGIGQAQARAFLESGANVFGFDLDEVGLKDLAKEYPVYFDYFIGSVCDKKLINEAVKRSIKQYKKINVLLNTAGILDDFKETLETDEALWDKVMNTNIKGTYLVTNTVLPYMLEQGQGVVINMASIAGMVGGGGGAAYTASKHAIVGYTKQLDLDYSRLGIRANAIAPGAIKTPMNEADFKGTGEIAKWVKEETPANHWAEPEEVAHLTLYLASDFSSYIHGTIIPIDGGWLAK